MFLLVVLCFVLASGEPLVSRRAVKRLSERVQGEEGFFFFFFFFFPSLFAAASGANANGVPVEFGLAALLRGEAEGVLEKSLFPAIEGLRKEAKALQQRYAKDTPLPAPTALRTMPRPMAEEPLKTLMELLSPEFPVFLGGTPFSFSTARGALLLFCLVPVWCLTFFFFFSSSCTLQLPCSWTDRQKRWTMLAWLLQTFRITVARCWKTQPRSRQSEERRF
jgi:hypothetical protein